MQVRDLRGFASRDVPCRERDPGIKFPRRVIANSPAFARCQVPSRTGLFFVRIVNVVPLPVRAAHLILIVFEYGQNRLLPAAMVERQHVVCERRLFGKNLFQR